MLEIYLKKIEEVYQTGRATELTYRSALEELLLKLVSKTSVIHEPMREDYGSPNYMVSRSTNHGQLKIGYIETKDIDANLESIELDAQRIEPKTRDGKQLKRYRQAINNLLLTNYREFRWYVHGERRVIANLVSPVIDKGIDLKKKGRKQDKNGALSQVMSGSDTQSTASVAQLLTGFLTHTSEPINNPKELAIRMARIAHIIRDMIIVALKNREAPGILQDLYEAFKQILLPNLDIAQFADMFAQTLAYGLFAARYNHASNEPFRRQDAAREIPNTHPFLADLFEKITGRELDNTPFVGFVDDLAQLLAQTDMNAVLADFGKRTHREDPLVHFYETFLAEYDPELRELRGVYYTPEPVVSYMVRSVDFLLRTTFKCPKGLADTSTTTYTSEDGQSQKRGPHVMLLDPACGTGTFLYSVIDHIRDEFQRTKNAGAWSSYVREHILPRLFGFELLMAPYAMAHLKLGMQLGASDLREAERHEWGYDFKRKERLGLYLTNTLEEAMQHTERLFARSISDEADAAAKVKQEYSIMVVLGNPPYSYESANVGEWIRSLVRDYYRMDGQPLGERNPRGLQDDYVKFMRFAQWRIDRTGEGILAFITNRGYLNNPTFRGMRKSLMQSFDEIHVLDLHGGTKPKEHPPSDIPDQNVFDIQAGVAISIFIKRSHTGLEKKAKIVYYHELWGARQSKYTWLAENELSTTKWNRLSPQPPSYSFVPQDRSCSEEYEQGWQLTQIMPVNSVGLYTARDDFAIQESSGHVLALLKEFVTLPAEIARQKYQLGPDSRDWQVALAQKDVINTEVGKAHIQEIAYRPFDTRFTYYTGTSRGLICMPRPEVMRHLVNKHNLAICFMRRSREHVTSNFYVAKYIVDKTILSSADNANVAPLYLYPTIEQTLLPLDNADIRRPNLSPDFLAEVTRRITLPFILDGKGDLQQNYGPEDIFDYMYAIFHSPTYRERYAEFLKMDFPRLPLTSNLDLFRKLCKIGETLVAVHLMETEGQDLPAYSIRGSDIVEKIEYSESSGSDYGYVRINETQKFEGISRNVWEFSIGGYHVCQKWLKDRKGTCLSYEDIRHYQLIVAALKKSIALMEQVDDVISEHGGWPIA